MTDTHSFRMNTLAGTDQLDKDVLIPDEQWVTLTEATYECLLANMGDSALERLAEALTMSPGWRGCFKKRDIYLKDYGIPVLVAVSPKAMKKQIHEIAAVPGAFLDHSSNESGLCHTTRFLQDDGTACLLPLIVTPVAPPETASPLIRHELVHLRMALTWGEEEIRDSYWNADLGERTLADFFGACARRTRQNLLEERLACKENFPPSMLDHVFDSIYIPQAIARLGLFLDLYLNDYHQDLDIDAYALRMRKTITKALANGGYQGTHGRSAVTVGQTAERIVKEAYKSWTRKPQAFDQLVLATMQREATARHYPFQNPLVKGRP